MDTHIPKPGPEHEQLAQLAGDWSGEETMFPSAWSPEEQHRVGRLRARLLDGFFVVSDYEQWTGDEVTFRGHGVYSWDEKAKEYVMYWFDSMGGAGGVARGHLEGNRLTFQNRSPLGHSRYRYTFEEGETVFEMGMSTDGETWQELMVGRYRPAR